LEQFSALPKNQSAVYVHWPINVNGEVLIFQYRINPNAHRRGTVQIDSAEA
jgi:hypothetical protein